MGTHHPENPPGAQSCPPQSLSHSHQHPQPGSSYLTLFPTPGDPLVTAVPGSPLCPGGTEPLSPTGKVERDELLGVRCESLSPHTHRVGASGGPAFSALYGGHLSFCLYPHILPEQWGAARCLAGHITPLWEWRSQERLYPAPQDPRSPP